MNTLSRRHFLQTSAAALAAVSTTSLFAAEQNDHPRKFTLDLVPGAIGVSANQKQAIDLAAKHGFESVGLDAGYLARLSDAELADLKEELSAKKLVFGAAGLPIEFRQSQQKFEEGLKPVESSAAAMKRAGLDRMATWLSPSSESLTFIQNFRQHATRLQEVARILRDQGVRLGLEYVGPKTAWSRGRFPFIHTMAELKDLIAEIGTGNVGFVLDSWHWWHAGETEQDILSLTSRDVVAVDLNDAPAGIPKDQQVDSRRELPAATGVIPVKDFVSALRQIGYDGPVRAEPFNSALNAMENDEACAATIASLKKAVS